MLGVVLSLLLLGEITFVDAKYQAPLYIELSPEAIPGEYIVVLNKQLSPDAVNNHLALVRKLFAQKKHSSVLKSVYQIGNFKGYSAKLSDSLRDLLRSMKEVAYVENNKKLHAAQCVDQSPAEWGLARISSKDRSTKRPLVYRYDPLESGANVDVYVLDSGIDTSHPEFEGRAKWGADFVADPSPMTDLNGHGTHVAGIIMSKTYGVAKKATAIAVRILDEKNVGDDKRTISGINWVVDQHKPGKKSVINMSLGGPKSPDVNDAVDRAVKKGIVVIAAAGNHAQDACTVSPASASKSITVMASNRRDELWSYSGYGPCAHIIAPGVDILSTWLDKGTAKIDGTSQAVPYVAGVVAMYLSSQSTIPTPASVKTWLINSATLDKISMGCNHEGTPNRLLYNQCV